MELQKVTKYLDENTVHERTREFLRFLRPYMVTHPLRLRCNPALLVIDVQRIFFDGRSGAFLPVAPTILKNIDRLISSFEKADRPVIFFRHIDKGSDPMAQWWGKCILADDWHSQMAIDRRMHPLVLKSSYDCFFETDLSERLRELGVDQIFIVGVMTHLCVESTARSAFVRGLIPVIPIDAVGSKNEYLHVSALTALAHGFSYLSSTEELKKCIEQLA